MSLVRRLTAPPTERRSATLAATMRALGIQVRSDAGGGAVDLESAQRVAAVWGCARLLADTVATMPWDVVRPTASGDRQPVEAPTLLRSPDGSSDPLAAIAWRRRVMWSLVLRGNAYGLVVADPMARYPAAIELLHPDAVTWRPTPSGKRPYIGNEEVARWPLGPLWHLTAYEAAGEPEGMSPLAYAAATISTALGAQEFGDEFFAAKAHPTSLLYSDQELDAAQAANLKQSVKRATAERDVLVLGAGLKWEAMQVSPNDSQFLATMQWSAQQICSAVFGVPAELLGYATSGQSVTYTNAFDRDLAFLKYGLSPWLVRLETAMSGLLPGKQQVKFNTGGLLRGDLPSRYAAYKTAAEIGQIAGSPLLTTSEMRAFEDLPPLA